MTRTSAFRAAAFAAVGAFALMTAPANSADTFTKEHLAAARAAIEASHVSDGFDNVLVAVADQTKANFVRSNPSFSTQIEAATNKVAVDLAARRVDLDHQVQQFWAAKFSQAELEDITKFYSSPVGQKLAKETNGIVAASVHAVQIYQGQLAQDMVTKVRAELKKQGLPF
ncbi:MAG: DUF2059 domain-containing protein [Ancalomicrobiaceae bacterium]|nr:DUF2059 domain-containing protein [Ancalomicrobiaceae bacterium]